MTTEPGTRSPISENLRRMADLLDQHPDMPQPYVTSRAAGHIAASWYLSNEVDDLPEQKTTAALIVKTIGGKWNKSGTQETKFNYTQNFDGLELTVQVERAAVCERIVTGTHEETVPAQPATKARIRVVEDVEWECKPLTAPEQPSALVLA